MEKGGEDGGSMEEEGRKGGGREEASKDYFERSMRNTQRTERQVHEK